MKLNRFMKKLNLIKKNNEGLALITVIVAIGFVTALVSVLMLTTLVNFKMKNVNERSKDTFYSAEQAINEINIGLQRVVSDSMSEAYLDIMTNYQTYDVDQKTDLLTTKYYEAIWKNLEKADKGNGFYDVAVLEGFLKNSTKWHTADGSTDGYGAIVVAVAEDGTESKVGQMITYQKSGVVLKGVKVYYKDQMGFVSVVQTDIRIQYPEFDFANTSELPTIPKYAFVADNGAKIEATNNLSLKGNMYANNLEITNGGAGTLNIYTAPDQVITSKYDFIINENINYAGKDVKRDVNGDPLASWTSEDGDSAVTLRARNIIIDSSDAKFSGKTLLANDLNIKGKNSDIVLVGEFTGYGMGANLNDSATDLSWKNTAISPDWSSSILINGKNTTLDMSGLTDITLYGHSFIGTGKVGYYNNRNGQYSYEENFSTSLTDGTTYSEAKTYNDLAMGESIAVKTNQMLYLLPSSVIGVDTDGKSKYNKNPLTMDEYQNLIKEVKAGTRTEYSTDVTVSELGTTLADFAKSNNQLGVQKIWARVNDSEIGSLVYYYISFDDEATANKYYAARYAASKEKFDNYASNYLKSIKWPNTDTMLTYNIAGNVIDKSGDDFERVPASIGTASASDEHKNKSIKYLKEFKGMCFNLETKQDEANYAYVKFEDTYEAEAKDAAKQTSNQIVFSNLISESNIEKFVNDVKNGVDAYDNVKMVSPGAHEIYVYDVSALSSEDKNTNPALGKKVAIICDDAVDVTIDDGTNSDVKLVITQGDVTVTRDFKGLILCDGKISFSGTNLRVEADPDEVRKILQFGYEDTAGTGDVVTIAYTLQDGTQYIYSASSSGAYTSDLALGGLISYENWKKD